jgi:hypothetical protein
VGNFVYGGETSNLLFRADGRAGVSPFRIGNWRNRHRTIRRRETTENKRFLATEINMQDILWILVTIAFFALSVGYVHFCDRLK